MPGCVVGMVFALEGGYGGRWQGGSKRSIIRKKGGSPRGLPGKDKPKAHGPSGCRVTGKMKAKEGLPER